MTDQRSWAVTPGTRLSRLPQLPNGWLRCPPLLTIAELAQLPASLRDPGPSRRQRSPRGRDHCLGTRHPPPTREPRWFRTPRHLGEPDDPGASPCPESYRSSACPCRWRSRCPRHTTCDYRGSREITADDLQQNRVGTGGDLANDTR